MATLDMWTALSARIRGLTSASHLAAELLTPGNDSLGVMVDLGKHASAILSDLRAFGTSLDPASDHASSAIKRAFQHLNRQIMVDEDVRQKWQDAHAHGETECEKLGAVHLLAHGIWAFKVNAAGGRTDLVYQEPMVDVAGIQRSADGLVLTEWKKLSRRSNRDALFETARTQAHAYTTGVLAGTELTHYRYAILVSEDNVGVPNDVAIGSVIYRHINIVIKPTTPSVRGCPLWCGATRAAIPQ